MNANMRFRLENCALYHEAVAKQHDVPEPGEADEYLAGLHADAAAQLRAVLEAEPTVNAVDEALARRTVLRNMQPAPRRRRAGMPLVH